MGKVVLPQDSQTTDNDLCLCQVSMVQRLRDGLPRLPTVVDGQNRPVRSEACELCENAVTKNVHGVRGTLVGTAATTNVAVADDGIILCHDGQPRWCGGRPMARTPPGAAAALRAEVARAHVQQLNPDVDIKVV